MRIVVAALAVVCASSAALACLQPVGQKLVGIRIQMEGMSAADFARILVAHRDRAHWETIRSDVESQLGPRRDLEYHNNLAVALIHLGRVDEAVPLLEAAERRWPGVYATAANLGTAYELSGRNEKALEWIKEGVRRDEGSHRGTEWLHVKILEAKLALAADPSWLSKHTVLGADFGAGGEAARAATVLDHLDQPKSLAQVEEALVYQLHERLEFVRPPDPTVADLLSELGNVLALTRGTEHAAAAHALARSYGSRRSGTGGEVGTRPEAPAAATPAPGHRAVLRWAVPVSAAAAVLAVAGTLYVLLRRRRAANGAARGGTTS